MTDRTDYLIRRLRLRHLELLVALADAGTMRAAATRLHLSQPALSKMLGEVEEGFGARLFERMPQGLTANGLGQAAIYRARVIIAELARGRDDINALLHGATGVLRLGTLSVTTSAPRAIARLRQRIPGARVQVQEGRVRDMVQRLLDGELDAVFGAITPELLTSETLHLLHPQVLLPDELCVVCADGHPLARARSLAWRDLQDAQWIAPPKDTLVRQALMTSYLNEGLQPPEPAVQVLSSVTIGSLLRLDPSLVAAVRLEHAADEVARGGARRLPLAPVMPLPSLGLYTRRAGNAVPALVLALAEELRAPAKRGRGLAARREH